VSRSGVTKLPGSKSVSLVRLSRHRRRINAMRAAMRTSPAMVPATLPTIAPALSPPEDVLLGLAPMVVPGSSEVVDGIGRKELGGCVLVTGAAVRVVPRVLDMIEDAVNVDEDEEDSLEEEKEEEEEEEGVGVEVVVGATMVVSVGVLCSTGGVGLGSLAGREGVVVEGLGSLGVFWVGLLPGPLVGDGVDNDSSGGGLRSGIAWRALSAR
jgi:hypothetical protein